MGAARLLHASPVLCVDEAGPTIDYLVDKLGFHVQNSVGEPVAWASMQRDDIELMLLADRSYPKPAQDWAAYVFIDDADELYEEVLALGADIKSPPADKPYHNREFEVRLPDGRILAFGANLLEEDELEEDDE